MPGYDIERRKAIQVALKAFANAPVSTASVKLLNSLGYASKKTTDLGNSAETLLRNIEQFKPELGVISRDKVKASLWKSCTFLFQLTNDEIPSLAIGQMPLGADNKVARTQIESLVFLAIDLQGDSWTRTDLAAITRELNKRFPMPAIFLFRHESLFSLAVIDRRQNLRDGNRDVIESRITIIKDVRFKKPHQAHVRILEELAIDGLLERRPNSFGELYEAWVAVVSTQKLNKRFYGELANWYFWAIQTIRFPDGGGESEEMRNATGVIRLITRLMFIWFIKERDLVPTALFDLCSLGAILKGNPVETPEESHYYKAILQNLFFATLNISMGEKRRFRGKNKSRGQDSHFCVHNIYRYEGFFRSPEEALKLFKDVPFLNGGLFECLDKPVEANGRTTCVRVDGFSDRPDNPLHVPNKLFFSDELAIDLNDVFGTRGKTYKTRGLIQILDSYKFTIDENTPVEEEVALDPELLGKVFENLLASYNPETTTTARKQTGSFYTPREIVDYMVDESLLLHLGMALESASSPSATATDRLLSLLSYSHEPHRFNEAEIAVLISAIDGIKVLDPACGSGAFPMGMLQKLVHVLGKLDPGNQEWKSRQTARVDKLMREAEGIEDSAIREHVMTDLATQHDNIEEAFGFNMLDYGRKLYLIENCIYGVDIQPIAVQIAKLRFFISLIVNETIAANRPNRGIRPLPNLETKFVVANSLIDIERPVQAMLSTHELEIKQIERELKRVRERYFHARTQETKDKFRAEDKILRTKLGVLLVQDGFLPGVASKLAAWDPYDQGSAAPFFDPQWMFELRDGFDIVIGNPPYLRVQGLQQTQPDFIALYRERFQSAKGSFDIYALFVERGYELLDQNGQLTYILPHKFFQASFGVGLRKLLTERKALREIVRFGAEQVFDEATTYTCLLFLTAQPQATFDMLEVRSLEKGEEVLLAARSRRDHPDYGHDKLNAPTSDDWDFTLGENNKVMQRLKQHSRTLGDITRKIFVGLQTSADKIYVLKLMRDEGDILRCYSKQLDAEFEIERGLTRPFLMGKDVHRYEPARPGNVVLFPYWIRNGRAILMSQAEIQQQFPLGWKYLLKSRAFLAVREHGRFADEWWAYGRPQNLNEFEAVKLMTPDICARPELTLDATGDLYHTTTLYSFVFKPEVNGSPYYFLGLLNSKVIWYFITVTGTPLRGDFYRFKTEYLRPFPIPDSTPEHQGLIEILVGYVLALKHEAANVADTPPRLAVMNAWFEQLIDALVYELYFPEEFSSVEARVSAALKAVRMVPLDDLAIAAAPTQALSSLFDTLHDPNHSVRRAAFFIDTIPSVRVIEGKD
ncbi:MAG: Eco57I restriction-modification methylase domain-containing protein [Nitrosospira sp.]|nr:Eco57I restriction-modification methylase domain-containing protein [Nitrosospira sp.]